MEILQELLLTAFISIVFAFFIAKLISLASPPDLDQDLAQKLISVVDPSQFPLSAEKIDGQDAAVVREIYGELLKDCERDGAELDERSSEDVEFCEYLVKRGIEMKSACDSDRIGMEECLGDGNGAELVKSGDMDLKEAEEVKKSERDGGFDVGLVEVESKKDGFEAKEEVKPERDGEFDVGSVEEESRSNKNELEVKKDEKIDIDARSAKEVPILTEDELKAKEEKKSESDGEFEVGLVKEEVKVSKEGFDGVEFARSHVVVDKRIADEKGSLFEDEDEWEGIERTELENRFGTMVSMVALGSDDVLSKIGSDVRMQLYGLHKVATEGPCYEPQPSILKVSARAKWY